MNRDSLAAFAQTFASNVVFDEFDPTTPNDVVRINEYGLAGDEYHYRNRHDRNRMGRARAALALMLQTELYRRPQLAAAIDSAWRLDDSPIRAIRVSRKTVATYYRAAQGPGELAASAVAVREGELYDYSTEERRTIVAGEGRVRAVAELLIAEGLL